jgi:hypothetical protein
LNRKPIKSMVPPPVSCPRQKEGVVDYKWLHDQYIL